MKRVRQWGLEREGVVLETKQPRRIKGPGLNGGRRVDETVAPGPLVSDVATRAPMGTKWIEDNDVRGTVRIGPLLPWLEREGTRGLVTFCPD